jgi:hypothetical protein
MGLHQVQSARELSFKVAKMMKMKTFGHQRTAFFLCRFQSFSDRNLANDLSLHNVMFFRIRSPPHALESSSIDPFVIQRTFLKHWELRINNFEG